MSLAAILKIDRQAVRRVGPHFGVPRWTQGPFSMDTLCCHYFYAYKVPNMGYIISYLYRLYPNIGYIIVSRGRITIWRKSDNCASVTWDMIFVLSDTWLVLLFSSLIPYCSSDCWSGTLKPTQKGLFKYWTEIFSSKTFLQSENSLASSEPDYWS